MAEIFISYSRRDMEFATRLHSALEADGRDAWIDWQGIPISAQWMQEIYEAIDAAHTFVFVISPQSIASETCRLELAYALQRKKRLVPVMAQLVVAEEMPADLAAIQYISFADDADFDAAFRSLVEAFDADLAWVKEHARLLVLAEEWNSKDRDAGYLLRGDALQKAETWLAQDAPERQAPLPIHRQFITSSRTQAKRRRRTFLALAAAVVLVVGAIGNFAYDRAEDARKQRALKLTAHANRDMFRYPGQAYVTALAAEAMHPAAAEADAARRTARSIIKQRMDLAARDRKNWDTGSPFIPLAGAFFKGKLIARISAEGRYVLLATERGETGNDPPGDAYLFDNESLRTTKLEPAERRDRIKRRVAYAGFSASGKKIYLARQYNVEIYDLEGRFEKEFYVSSTKYPITLVDGVKQDTLLVVGDSTGPVWIVDAKTEREKNMFFRYSTNNPLVSFALSPSGKTAVMVLKKGEAYLWRIGEEEGRFPPQIPHKDGVEIALFKPAAIEESWLTAGADGVARLWRFRDDAIEPVADFDHQGEAIGYVTFLDDPPRLATFTLAGKNRVWNMETASLLSNQ